MVDFENLSANKDLTLAYFASDPQGRLIHSDIDVIAIGGLAKWDAPYLTENNGFHTQETEMFNSEINKNWGAVVSASGNNRKEVIPHGPLNFFPDGNLKILLRSFKKYGDSYYLELTYPHGNEAISELIEIGPDDDLFINLDQAVEKLKNLGFNFQFPEWWSLKNVTRSSLSP